jgi:hypothetical protein
MKRGYTLATCFDVVFQLSHEVSVKDPVCFSKCLPWIAMASQPRLDMPYTPHLPLGGTPDVILIA